MFCHQQPSSVPQESGTFNHQLICDSLRMEEREREINSASWGRRGCFHTEMVRGLSSTVVKTKQWFRIHQLWSITTIGPKLLNAASQSVHFHRVEQAWLHQWDTNTTPDTNGTPSPSSALSAICLLTSTPRQPKAPCHLLEVEGWAGDRSRKTTCLRSSSDSNNYHAIIHRQCCVFFSSLLRADKLKIPGFEEDVPNRTRKKRKKK